MARASRFALLSVACVGCWFDIADIDSSATQTSASAGGAPATTSSSPGGQGGTAGAASGAGGQGGLVTGGAGGEGEMGGSGGSAPEPPPFQSCEPLGYLGTCAGPAAELLFYWNEDYDTGSRCASNRLSRGLSHQRLRRDDTSVRERDMLRCTCGVATATSSTARTPTPRPVLAAQRRDSTAERDRLRVSRLLARRRVGVPRSVDGEPNADCFAPP